TDVYAFGALVFQVLAGQVPFDGQSPMDVLLKHMTVEPPRASAVCRDVPPQLDEPIRRMMAKESAYRPASVGAALETLVAAGNAAGILAASAYLPPPSDPGAPFHGAATLPTGGATMQEPVRIVTGSDAAPNGHTFLASEADVLPPRTSRARLGAMAAVVLLACAVTGAFVMGMRKPHEKGTAGLVAAPSAEAALPPSAAPPPSVIVKPAELVTITLDATPKDAKIMQGAKELGAAPGPFSFPAGAPVTLTVVAKGFKSQELTLTPTASTAMPVSLEKLAAPIATAKGPAGKGKPISSDLENFDTSK
ncbi:MAG TPA: hypothetical protein VLT33_42625, partial [Labilithrix sp.]|nr:hypothetical protein [Labilithrix sp.]